MAVTKGESGGIQIIDFEKGGYGFDLYKIPVVSGGGNDIGITPEYHCHGSYAGAMYFDGTNEVNYFYDKIADSLEHAYLRLYFMIPSSFNAGMGTMQLAMILDNDSNPLVWAAVQFGRDLISLAFLHGAWDSWNAADPNTFPIERDTWYCLELHFRGASFANGGSEAWLDGNQLYYGLNKNAINVYPHGYLIGQQGGVIPNGEYYVDDIVFDSERIGLYPDLSGGTGGGSAMKRSGGTWCLTSGDSTDERLFRKLRWVSKDCNIGDECILKDESGQVIFHSVAPYTNWNDSFELNKVAKVYIEKLDSGTLYLYE